MAGTPHTLALNAMPDEAWQDATRGRDTRYATVAANNQKTSAAKRQRAVIAAAKVKRFPFMDLPKEVRDIIIELTMPDCLYEAHELEVSVGDWDLKGDPDFLSPLAKQGNEQLRLEILELTLPKFVLKVTSMEETIKLRVWLASIDFGPMVQGNINPIKNGFDVVGGLLFSDINRVKIHHVMGDDYHFRLPLTWHYWKRPSSEPSTPAGDIELARMCRDLRSLTIQMSVTKRFVHDLEYGQGMPGALKTNGFGMYKVRDLLKLKGLKVLYLQLFTRHWVSGGLERSELFESGCMAVSTWLSDEFRKRGETVEVHCR